MAGSATITSSTYGGITRHTVSWTSDASGDMDAGAFHANGLIRRVVTNPGAGPPTDNYDVVVNDEDGVDVMAAGLANRDTANSEQVISDPPVAVAGTIDPVVSNAGNATSGTIVFYIE